MESIFETLSKYTVLSSAYKTHLENVLMEEFFQKGERIMKPERMANRAYFVKKGSVIAYYYENDQKYLSWYWRENDFIFVEADFHKTEHPSTIEVIEDSILLSISYDELVELNNNFKEARTIERKLIAERFQMYESRIKNFQTLSGEEHYRKLLEQRPDLIQKISQFNLASFIGVNKETLSRYRGKRNFFI